MLQNLGSQFRLVVKSPSSSDDCSPDQSFFRTLVRSAGLLSSLPRCARWGWVQPLVLNLRVQVAMALRVIIVLQTFFAFRYHRLEYELRREPPVLVEWMPSVQ